MNNSNHVLVHNVDMRSFSERRGEGESTVVRFFVLLGHGKADGCKAPKPTDNLVVLLDGEHEGDGEGLELFEDRVCQAPDGLLVQHGMEEVLEDFPVSLEARPVDVL